MTDAEELIRRVERVSARNYAPLPVVIQRAEGVWAWDTEGRKYLDCLSAYSSLSLGHRHPRVIAALIAQAGKLTLTSRAFHNDQMGPFLEALCELSEMEMALPMNTGAEAVETAIKLVRKWGYRTKGVANDQAEFIACRNNFHGRTTTLVGFSSEAMYRQDFGPYSAGFQLIDFGDAGQLAEAITPNTVAFLVEPIQAEAGILVPPAGYLSAARRVCSDNNVLFVLDEIQTGLGRTGKMFAYQHEEDAKPDVLILEKHWVGASTLSRLRCRRPKSWDSFSPENTAAPSVVIHSRPRSVLASWTSSQTNGSPSVLRSSVPIWTTDYEVYAQSRLSTFAVGAY
jgi:ornithine--oxo-acid transaminase